MQYKEVMVTFFFTPSVLTKRKKKKEKKALHLMWLHVVDLKKMLAKTDIVYY